MRMAAAFKLKNQNAMNAKNDMISQESWQELTRWTKYWKNKTVCPSGSHNQTF